jgi:uncharacterized protein
MSLATSDGVMTIKTFVKSHPVLTYFALVFAISWSGALVVFGPGVFLGTKEISVVGQSPFAYLAFLAGPSVAGILSAGLVHGRAGLRDVRSRLLRWRVGVRWYAVALLTAPLLMTATLFALSLTSPVFLPAIITASDKTSLLVSGIAVGLVVPFFEELGWTGFAIPELGKRYDILTTGLIVGLLWGAWHFPLFSGSASSSGAIPPALYLAVLLFSWLPSYRLLMMWVHDHTKSLLVLMLMHVPIDFGGLVLISPAMSGVPVVAFDLVFAAALWVVVAVLAVANCGQLSRQPLRRRPG